MKEVTNVLEALRNEAKALRSQVLAILKTMGKNKKDDEEYSWTWEKRGYVMQSRITVPAGGSIYELVTLTVVSAGSTMIIGIDEQCGIAVSVNKTPVLQLSSSDTEVAEAVGQTLLQKLRAFHLDLQMHTVIEVPSEKPTQPPSNPLDAIAAM